MAGHRPARLVTGRRRPATRQVLARAAPATAQPTGLTTTLAARRRPSAGAGRAPAQVLAVRPLAARAQAARARAAVMTPLRAGRPLAARTALRPAAARLMTGRARASSQALRP